MVEIYTDGACVPNPGMMSIGVAFYKDKQIISTISKLVGEGTNNIAELIAVKEALECALNNGYLDILIKGDSQIVYEGVFGKGGIRHPNLVGLAAQAKELAKKFNHIEYEVIPRELNSVADELSMRGYPMLAQR